MGRDEVSRVVDWLVDSALVSHRIPNSLLF